VVCAAASATVLPERLQVMALASELPATGISAMVNSWLPILLFFVVAVAFGIVTLLIARLVVPQKYGRVKLDPYECGIEVTTDARDRYSGSC